MTNISKITIPSGTYDIKDPNVRNWVASRGENLVSNGTALLGDNTNFSNFKYDGSDTYYAGGSFSYTSGSVAVFTDEFIPVNPSNKYQLSYYIKNDQDNIKYYDMLVMYDIDKNIIWAYHIMWIKGSTTTLAKDLKNGDTVVYLTDVSGFYKKTTLNYQKGFIFWDYKNHFGYQFPTETYSRHVYSNRWTDSSAFNDTNNTITLSSPWTGGTHVAGTAVSQSNDGGNYSYGNGNFTLTKGLWTQKSVVFSGLGKNNEYKKFREGTAFVKVGWLLNREGKSATNPTTWLSTIELTKNYGASETAEKSTKAVNDEYGNRIYTSYARTGMPNNFISYSTELNLIPAGYNSTSVYFNFRGADSNTINATITDYYFGNGKKNAPETVKLHGSATSARVLSGFSNGSSDSISWGVLKRSEYTPINRMDTSSGGSVCFADSNGQTSMQIDGLFYQNEGTYKVLDTSNIDTSLSATSTNPVQNKVVNSALTDKQDKLAAGTNITISGTTISAKDTTYSPATTLADGLMTKADKKKLDGISEGATKIIVDPEISDSSTNPVQNQALAQQFVYINQALDKKQNKLTIDEAMSQTSTNPVQNKVIKKYVDDLAYDLDEMDNMLNGKQDKLTAGTGISISGNTISATGTTTEATTMKMYDGWLVTTCGNVRTAERVIQFTNMPITSASANTYYSTTPYSTGVPSELFSDITMASVTPANGSISSGVYPYRAIISSTTSIKIDFRAHASSSNASGVCMLRLVGTKNQDI